MSVYDTVIVGTDGSVTANRAVRRAATLAHSMGAPLIVTTAYQRQSTEDLGPPSAKVGIPSGISAFGYIAAQETSRDGAAVATRAFRDLSVDVATPQGEAAEALLDFAESRGDCLVVIGSQGLGASGLFLLGNVPNKITHHAVSDVMVVRTSTDRDDGTPERLLVGTDGSRTATIAVDRAIEVAGAVGGSVTLVAVGKPGWATDVLAEASARVEAAGVAVATEHHEGDPAGVLVDRATDFDLLVLGNRGMTGARRFLLGSVPNKVSHHTGADLLIVKTS